MRTMSQTKKSERQIALMRRAGLVVYEAHRAAAAMVRPGVATAEIDAVVDSCIASHGAEALFKGHRMPGTFPFPAASCISVNDEIVHGIPGPRRLEEGDLVSVDIGVRYQGWCADAAVTWPVGQIKPELARLLAVTEGALRLAIKKARPNVYWSKVARAMEANVTRAGPHVIEDLCGHGIGEEMWEPPNVLNYFSSTNDFKLVPGLVLAVEPMIALGTKKLRSLRDGWTYVTADGSAAAHFEHTIAITEKGVSVLTAGPNGSGWAL